MSSLHLKNGKVFDPSNNTFNKKRDVYINNGKIVKSLDKKAIQTIDCQDKIIMPGAIDLHTHIGGGKVNIARLMLQEFHNNSDNDYDLTANFVPSTLKTGLQYIEMGYTSCFEPALLPINARQSHAEMADIPFIDKGGYALLGNDDFLLDLISRGADQSEINDYVAFVIKASQCIGIKVVNPGGINAFKFNQRALNVDEKSIRYKITPRKIVRILARAVYELGIPHPLHVHCSNLGVPGNFKSTIETIKAAEGLPIHITHIQFHSYGNNGDRNFSSASAEITEHLNKIPNLTCDVGQVLFGQTATMSGDSMKQHANHKHAHPDKWLCMDIECEAGCGVVPFKYTDQSFVNALQWAIGLETFLLAEDANKIFLTTDHPNGAPFTSYPHLIKLLMDKTFRDDLLDQMSTDISQHTILKDIKREYTLSEIATMTRSAPARILGLENKGSLSENADADITIYDSNINDVEEMFAHPSHVIKDGVEVVRNGEIKNYMWGKTQVVKPEHDPSIEKKLDKYFKKFHTIGLSNYIISNDEMSETIGSDININECLRKRIS
tara:strand:- start:1914 stop:3569 length:1656 start_codon:yes stop_codon:yes gene_type:complete